MFVHGASTLEITCNVMSLPNSTAAAAALCPPSREPADGAAQLVHVFISFHFISFFFHQSRFYVSFGVARSCMTTNIHISQMSQNGKVGYAFWKKKAHRRLSFLFFLAICNDRQDKTKRRQYIPAAASRTFCFAKAMSSAVGMVVMPSTGRCDCCAT